MFDLNGQTAVVIGGARDLGYDMADILAAAGCDIALTSRDAAKAEAAAEKLRAAHGCDVLSATLDICNYAQVTAFAEQVQAWRTSTDILVNNAGGGLNLQPTHFFDRDPEHIAQLVNTTQEAGFKLVQWDGSDIMGRSVGAGVYLYQIRAGEFVQTRKMVLLK